VPRLTRVEKQAETRALLLDAAAREVAERGYADAHIDRISETAGFSKGAFYSNFRSKDELVLAVFERTLSDAMNLPFQGVGSAARDPRSLMNALSAQTSARLQEDRLSALLRLELLHQSIRNTRLRDAVVGHYNELVATNAGLFAQARVQLGLRPLPHAARAAAELYLAVILGVALLRCAGAKLTPAGSLAASLLNVTVAEDPMAPAALQSKPKRTRRPPRPAR